jgi:hypothetical protein
MNKNNASAVMDAAIAYGASRWMRSIHDDPKYDKTHDFKKNDDKWLFVEFLHNLLFYDRITMDITSSRWFYAKEIMGIFQQVNHLAKIDLLVPGDISPYDGDDDDELEVIAEGACHLIKIICDAPDRQKGILSVDVPTVYKSTSHHDYEMMAMVATKANLALEMLPFALFSYRGLCYSGFANFQSRINKAPTAYLASPGRIAALKELVDAQALKRITGARQAYIRVGEVLKLPENGYNFSHLPSLDPLRFSQLAQAVVGKPALDALQFTIKLRDSAEGKQLREAWTEKIFAGCLAPSLGIANGGEQKMENIQAGGDVIQIYHAAPDE